MRHIFSRRDVLKTMGVAGGAAVFSPALLLAQTHHPDKPMIQRAIPSTGEKLPVVGLGSWQQFDVAPSGTEASGLKDVLVKMKALGGKVIDSSPMYGRAEQVIGDLTRDLGINNDFFFATKVWTTGKQAGIDQMNDSMRKMGRTKLDLIQVHNLQDWQTHLKTLKDWKEQGKVRYIGITHYTDSAHSRLEQIIRSEQIDFVQFNYSLRSRNAERSLLHAAAERKVAVLINEPFEQGALFRAVKGKELPGWAADYGIKSWAQFFLKYIIGNPAVTCVIPGTSDVKHLTDNLEAGTGTLPDSAGLKKMADFIQTV
ncbi:aldo/keto reductase [Dyadobacter sandarakinus]|uniref:Aldo/keto reductase n=1 Tax=Dyadobacter sandarakinus TaxID=2747268 RepID=A0ABX7I4I3_9BACT|nr:aldo/keto reductase [Dyadobacter sandarakinus]QRR00999.1 aldo/keto reductase [Dyadobacter sandarakinus]